MFYGDMFGKTGLNKNIFCFSTAAQRLRANVPRVYETKETNPHFVKFLPTHCRFCGLPARSADPRNTLLISDVAYS